MSLRITSLGEATTDASAGITIENFLSYCSRIMPRRWLFRRLLVESTHVLSWKSSSSYNWIMVSSRSFKRAVSPIIMSLCFRSKCLYLSTWTLSSSSCCRSRSISFSFCSYSCLIIFCFSSSADLNCGVCSIVFPPIRSWEFSALIFALSFYFSSFSAVNSFDLSSKADSASYLSYSSLFRVFSIYMYAFSSTPIILAFFSSSARSRFSSSSYFLRRAF